MATYVETQTNKLADRLAKLEEKHPHPAPAHIERRKNRLTSAMQRWQRLKYKADRQVARAGFA